MNLREATQQALDALESLQGGCTDSGDGTVEAITVWCPEVIDALRAALAEDARDWSLLEATQESLREHMAEIQRLRAALAQPAASGEPDMRHPKIQALIGGKARREIELRLVEQLLDDPDCDLSAMDMEYWHGLHDKLREKLTAAPAQPAPAPECDSPKLCAVNGACAGQYGTKKQCATAQPAPARVPSSVRPEAHADFVRALHGGKGDLDAWLECYDETEVRAHVLALVQQPAASGEPVAWLWKNTKTDGRGVYFEDPAQFFDMAAAGDYEWTPLYAAPQPAPARVPLTDEQIDRITAEQWGRGLGAPYAAYRAYARAIEAAHGIAAPGAPDAPQSHPQR